MTTLRSLLQIPALKIPTEEDRTNAAEMLTPRTARGSIIEVAVPMMMNKATPRTAREKKLHEKLSARRPAERHVVAEEAKWRHTEASEQRACLARSAANKLEQQRLRGERVRAKAAAAVRTFGDVQLEDESLRSFLATIKANDEQAIDALLTSGELGRLRNFQNHSGDSALHLAAWHGFVRTATKLLRVGADTDLINCDGNSALNCAAYRGHLELCELLCRHGAEPEVADCMTGKTALLKAAYAGHVDVVRVLLAADADPDAVDNEGYSALAFAACAGNVELLGVLLDSRADPNSADRFGVTPLIHATARGDEASVRRLLEEAATKVDLADHEGRTAASYAHANGQERLVAILEEVESADLRAFGMVEAEAEAVVAIRAAIRSSGRHASADCVTPRRLSADSMPPPCTTPLMPRVPIARRPPLPPLRSARGSWGSDADADTSTEEMTPPPSAERMATAARDGAIDAKKVTYLTKKLCNLMLLLEQDTRAADHTYPSAAPPKMAPLVAAW
uniref:Uncharacterized protein n=1 Tax=Prymnesium polylepis TaxID=72548 RepID=A0A6T8A9H4_9EUKA